MGKFKGLELYTRLPPEKQAIFKATLKDTPTKPLLSGLSQLDLDRKEWIAMARMLCDCGKLGAAVKIYEKLRMDDEKLKAYRNAGQFSEMAEILAKDEKHIKAAKAYRKARKPKEAGNEYLKCLEARLDRLNSTKDPVKTMAGLKKKILKLLDAVGVLSEECRSVGNNEEAKELYKRLAERINDSIAVTKRCQGTLEHMKKVGNADEKALKALDEITGNKAEAEQGIKEEAKHGIIGKLEQMRKDILQKKAVLDEQTGELKNAEEGYRQCGRNLDVVRVRMHRGNIEGALTLLGETEVEPIRE